MSLIRASFNPDPGTCVILAYWIFEELKLNRAWCKNIFCNTAYPQNLSCQRIVSNKSCLRRLFYQKVRRVKARIWWNFCESKLPRVNIAPFSPCWEPTPEIGSALAGGKGGLHTYWASLTFYARIRATGWGCWRIRILRVSNWSLLSK